MIDWGLGHYERTAVELEPVAAQAVAVADLHHGERVVDLATGTGNAAVIATRSGCEKGTRIPPASESRAPTGWSRSIVRGRQRSPTGCG